MPYPPTSTQTGRACEGVVMNDMQAVAMAAGALMLFLTIWGGLGDAHDAWQALIDDATNGEHRGAHEQIDRMTGGLQGLPELN